jgi:hypothetical protein
MKNLLFFFSLCFLMLFSCSSEDDSNNSSESALIGVWNLISDKDVYGNSSVELITTCQLAYWQWNFLNDSDLIFRSTSDDPSLELNECDPNFYNGNYSVDDNEITMIIIRDDGNETITVRIESLSNSTLVLRLLPDEEDYYRQFTLEKD